MDFTAYTAPSAEWLALEPKLPPFPDGLGTLELRKLLNDGREAASAKQMVEQDLASQVSIQTFSIPTRDSSIEARSYRPSSLPSSTPLPIYIHLHGGGFLLGTLSSEDASCARIVTNLLARNCPVVVVNVNYRHTPEHKYPAAWHDVEDAFRWVHANAGLFGGDAARVVVGGISAGAKLAASLTLLQHLGIEKDLAALPRIKGQILMIPSLLQKECHAAMLDKLSDPSVSSFVDCKDAPVLPVERIRFFNELLGAPAGEGMAGDRRLNPGNAGPEEVKGLPPSVFGVAGRDPLRDEGLLYAKVLSENGVPTKTYVYPGVPHGFRRFGDGLPTECKRWDETIFDGIQWALSGPEATGKFEIIDK